jgi:hypothetical protein
MTKGIRRIKNREPSAPRKGADDEYQSLNISQDSRRAIRRLHSRDRRELLARLGQMKLRSASFSIPSARISSRKPRRINVDAKVDPTSHLMSVNIS